MSTNERIELLEERVRALEDVTAIYRLMASYGPAVDSDSRAKASGLWTKDGEYNVDVGVWHGSAEIEGMLAADMHQDFLTNGCAHQVSMPRLTIDGDTATAICYQQLVKRSGDHFTIVRQTANRWDFVRTPDGWRVSRRLNRLLDGTQEPRDVLRQGLDEAP